MKLFTITATPVCSREQYAKVMPSNKVLTDKELDKLNAIAIEQYPNDVAELLAKYDIDGFTIYQVQVYWKGTPEVSFKIELAIDSDPERVYTVAKVLRDLYNQEAVMLTKPNGEVEFI